MYKVFKKYKIMFYGVLILFIFSSIFIKVHANTDNGSKASVNNRALDFPPPELGDVGMLVFTDQDTPEGARAFIKEKYIPSYLSEELEKTVNDELGNKVGDSITFTIGADWLFVANWMLPTGYGIRESYYGKVRPFNMIAVSSSDDLKTTVTSDPNVSGSYIVKVTRLKSSTKDNYDIFLKYDYNFDYYESLFAFNSWGKWMEMPTETINQLETKLNIKSDPKPVATLQAESVDQSVSLGTDVTQLNTSNFIKNVKLGDDLLSPDQYTTELTNDLYTDTVGEQIAKVRLFLKDKSQYIDIDVPFKVDWGNSIVFGGYDYSYNGRTTAAFTLFTGDTPTIVASQGKNDDNLEIHSNFKSELYYKFNWFDLSNVSNLNIKDDNNGTKYIKADGNDLKRDKLKDWGTNQRQPVNYGDVVGAWIVEPGKSWLYENGIKNSYDRGKNSIYYEITNVGYKVLNFNHLTTNLIDVPIASSKEYLDKHIEDYVDTKEYPNIRVKEFSKYPDTRSLGLKKGNVVVEETLTTGKKIYYEYEVEFNIVEQPLNLSVPSSSSFGTHKLGSNNTVLLWNETSKVVVEGGNNSQWDLSVALNSNSSLKGYMKIGDRFLTETSQKVVSGKGPMTVTDEVSSDKFIKIDYTDVVQLRQDKGTLQWTLTASTKGVSE